MSTEETIKHIEEECHRIEEDTKVTAKSQYNDADALRRWHRTLAISATVLATAAGFSAIKTYHWGTAVIIGCSFLSAIITTLLSTFKPLEQAATHHQFGVDFQKLCDDTRIFRSTMLHQDSTSEKELIEAVQILSDRRSKLRGDAPQHSYKAFIKSNKGIQNGEASYEVDKVQKL